jgi:hypothetical protein
MKIDHDGLKEMDGAAALPQTKTQRNKHTYIVHGSALQQQRTVMAE